MTYYSSSSQTDEAAGAVTAERGRRSARSERIGGGVQGDQVVQGALRSVHGFHLARLASKRRVPHVTCRAALERSQ